jgi:catechol 2,3-dioxygenase-like lactoylglutathione lyase family enzyme
VDLGAFWVSLSVRDLAASRRFYEALGFTQFHGDASQGWLILRNASTVIGLFQGMLDRNTLTFNPGWDGNAQPVERYTDVRELQHRLKDAGIEIATEVDESGSGPGFFMVNDPDANPIFVDQHV